MKFRIQFDFHKIPEWYQEYFDYLRFKLLSKDFSERVKSNNAIFLKLFVYRWAISENQRTLHLDLEGLRCASWYEPSWQVFKL